MKATTIHEEEDLVVKRERAQKLAFAKMKEIMQRNPNANISKTFTQYTKELLKQYIGSPANNQDTLREISRFLARNSMLYQKILMYYASIPLFYYNITQMNDFSSEIDFEQSTKDYQKVLEYFNALNLRREGYTSLYIALRDGVYIGYAYDSKKEGIFTMPLDAQYCRIYGKTETGEWIVYFNAAFFDAGNNNIYVTGINKDGIGTWDKVFVDGYNAFKADRNRQWFMLPPEKTVCLLTCSEDEFAYPLPFFLPLFTSLLDLLDLEQILMSKTELENYKLIVSKIPLISNSEEVDDFAISLDLAQMFNQLMENAVSDLVGVVYSPMDIDTVTFEKANSSADTDELGKSIQNLFNNAGASQSIVAGGASTNSIGLKYSKLNDIATAWVFVDRYQSWINYFIKKNISNKYYFQFHKISWYNQEEYIEQMRQGATLGTSALDYLTALGDSPYIAIQKLRFENAIKIKDIMIPLQSSYNMSTRNNVGRPRLRDDEISDSGAQTRDSGSNENRDAQ